MSGDDLRKKASATHSAYDAQAASYRDLWAPRIHGAGLELIQAMGMEEAGRVLDLGTGVGSLLRDIQQSAPNAVVIGGDRVMGMIRLAPRAFPLVVLDAATPPFVEGAIDAVVMAFVLFHLEEPLEGLRSAHRILAPGGVIGTATWGDEQPNAADVIWNQELEREGAGAEDSGLAQHELVDTPAKMRALLSEAGFQSDKVWVSTWTYSPDAEEFMTLRTSCGQSRRRLDTLAPDVQLKVIERIRRRLRNLEHGDFHRRAEVILATATSIPE